MKLWIGLLAFLAASANANANLAPQTCGNGQHWVKAHFRRPYVRADGKHFRATTVVAHCSKNPPGFSFWNSKLKGGTPPGWAHPKEVPKSWTDEERERMLEALGYLPNAMWRNDVQGFYRMADSVYSDNPASGDRNGNFVIYDNAFENQVNLAQILAHEDAHRIFESFSPDEIENYRFAAGWINMGTPEQPNFVLVRKGMVADDSANSIEEDFSNNVEYYLFNPSKLKGVSPGAYDWIANHFGDNFKLGKGSP